MRPLKNNKRPFEALLYFKARRGLFEKLYNYFIEAISSKSSE